MKKFFILAVLCLLVSASPVSAQLIIHNNGHAEIGHNPFENDFYNPSVLRIFGNEVNTGANGHISFGDSTYVTIGELGSGDCDRLWLHGQNGTYLTAVTNTTGIDTIAFFDPARSTYFTFNSDVTTSGVFVQSDERFKENVEPVGDVLSSLKQLEAVTYNLKGHQRSAAGAALSASNSKDIRQNAVLSKYHAELAGDSERYGFLAQNVKEVFPELVHTDNSGYMYVDYIGLIPILVQSINELRAELAELKGENEEEEAPVMQALQQAGQNELKASMNAAKLYQNAPNPWNSETVIRYSLPESVSRAEIYIYDMQGAQLKSITARGRGESQVTLTAHDLKAGMYLYALVADGALIDSKQMIITK